MTPLETANERKEIEFGSDMIFDNAMKMLIRLPFSFDWVEYKGETVFAQINYEATHKAKKPMIDISYCATQACNQNILFTCQYDKNKFKPSRLGMEWINKNQPESK